MSDTKYLTILEAAAVVECHEETIRRAIRRGQLKAITTPAGTRVHIDTLGLPADVVARLRPLLIARIQGRLAALPPRGAR